MRSGQVGVGNGQSASGRQFAKADTCTRETLDKRMVRRYRTRCEKRASLSQTRQLYFQAQFAPPQDKDQAKTAACKAASKAPQKFLGGTS